MLHDGSAPTVASRSAVARDVRTGAGPIDQSMATPLPFFEHEPRTEQEVVCLFGAMLNDLDYPLIIERVQTPFPDCTVRRTDTNERLRIEFELFGSHFRQHGHPLDGCDVLVCWVDDLGGWPEGFTVWELSQIVAARRPELIANLVDRDPKAPWDEAAFFAQAATDGASPRDIELTRAIVAFARRENLGPQWLVNPSAVFAVGRATQYFKVHSTGRIGFPFSRLGAAALFPELRARLNAAVPALSLEASDERSKGKGGRLSVLLETNTTLDLFLEVWAWFGEAKLRSPR